MQDLPRKEVVLCCGFERQNALVPPLGGSPVNWVPEGVRMCPKAVTEMLRLPAVGTAPFCTRAFAAMNLSDLLWIPRTP